MTQSKIPFGMDAAVQALRDAKSLNGKDGVLTPLKLLYAGMLNQGTAHPELEPDIVSADIHFPDRLEKYFSL